MQLYSLGINVLRWYVGDQASSGRIIQRRNVFFNEFVTGRETRHHDRVRVTTERLFEQLSKL